MKAEKNTEVIIADIKMRINEKKSKTHYNSLYDVLCGEVQYPSSDYSMQSIDESAINCIKKIASEKSRSELTWDDIATIHRSFIKDSTAGKIRGEHENCYIKRPNSKPYSLPTFLELNNFKLVEEFIQWVTEAKCDTVDLAALVHIKFTVLHPFSNGNGRTAHLLMNMVLLQDNYPFISFGSPDAYFKALDRTRCIRYLELLNLDEMNTVTADFYLLVYQMVEKSLDEYYHM